MYNTCKLHQIHVVGNVHVISSSWMNEKTINLMNKLLLSLQETAPITLTTSPPILKATKHRKIKPIDSFFVNLKCLHRTLNFISVVVVVALVGRELYDSNRTTKPECPNCKAILVTRRRSESPGTSDNAFHWENGRCANISNNLDEYEYGYEYTVILKRGAPCCSLPMSRFQDPYIIWVRLQKLK